MIFSDTTNRTGLVQHLEDATHTQSDNTPVSSYSLARKTVDINQALAHFVRKAVKIWKGFDLFDSEKFPIVYFNLINSQDNYVPTYDGEAIPSKIFGFFQVRVKNKLGNFNTLTRISRVQEDISRFDGIIGEPTHYEVIGNGIILYPRPDYDSPEGIEVFIDRAPNYFTISDTIKEAGIPDSFHDYLWIRPAYLWCLVNLPSLAVGYRDEMLRLEQEIDSYYSDISSQVQIVITTPTINSI